MQDKRFQGRWTISDKVLYKKEGEEALHESLSQDISSFGARISSSEALAPNTELDLNIRIGDSFEPISAKAKVIWSAVSNDNPDAPYLAGLRLISLKYIDKDKIFHYAFNYRKEEVIQRWWQGA